MGKSWSTFLWQLERKRKYYMSFNGSGNGGRRSRAGSTMATVIVFLLCFLLYINLSGKHSDSGSAGGTGTGVGTGTGSGTGAGSGSGNDGLQNSNSNNQVPFSNLNSGDKRSIENRLPLATDTDNDSKDQGFSGEARLINPRIPAKRLVPPARGAGGFKLPDLNGKDTVDNVDLENLENASAFAVSGDIEERGGGEFTDAAKFESKRMKAANNGHKNHVRMGNGNGNESHSNHRAETTIAKLKRHFYKADTNRDGFLSSPEISKWINEEIKTHFSTALKENFDSFFRIDNNPRNGRVEWAEYLDFHLKNMGYKGPVITPEVLRSKEGFKKLPKHIKVEIAALEARWSENANNNPDFLTVDEFLSFTHPEASPTKLLAVVQDTFATFDLDGDGIITKTEFDTTYAEAEGVDNVFREDLHLIDADQDNRIERVELMRYMDPKNTVHSDKDTEKLIQDVDENQDGQLSLDEILNKQKIVIASKFFDAGKNLHAHHQLHN